MSLASPYQEHYYVADGVTTSFSFGEYFTGLSQAYVKCIIYFDDGTNCVPTFTVDMTTGFITIVTLTKPDGTVLTVPPVGSIVRVFRDTPEQQNVTASQLQNYTAKQLERIFDSVVAMIQEVSYSDLHKTIRLTETQRDLSVEQLTEEKDQSILYWDFESRTLKATDYGQDEVVKSETVDRLLYLQPEGKIYFIPKGSTTPISIGSVSLHNDLGGRNAPDCHPESAITGLREHLQELRDKDIEIEEDVQIALNRSQEAKDTADEAKETAEYAQTVAGQAKDIAEDAKETAEGIEDIAEEAKDIAQDAKDVADEALDKVTQEITDREDADDALQDQITDNKGAIEDHIADTNNPHSVTKAQVGLGNVDNTSDLNKPISTATQTALDLKADKSTTYTKTETDTLLSGKQDTISDLATIRSNAQAGKAASDTIATYGDIVTHDVAEFATAAQGAKADTAVQPSDLATVATTGSYTDLSDKPTIGNATLTIQKNSTTIDTFTANATSNKTIDIAVPTKTSDITNDSNYQNGTQVATAISTHNTSTTAHSNQFNAITEKIPAEASSSNKLADKAFVNSSIATNTANFIGTFNSVAELEAYSGTVTNNDYAFVIVTDSAGNTAYDRYKYTTATTPASWVFEYELNNSSFTAEQWAAINSGANTTNIGQIATNTTTIGNHIGNTNNPHQVTKAQVGLGNVDNTSDLAKPISTATQTALNAKANTADLATVATSGSYNDLSDKPTIPTVNNATLTIQKNGTTVQTFTANQSTNATANISVPTKTSDITNDSGFITSSALAPYALSADLATVATTGDYDDLSNKPTIPAAQVNSDWNANSGVAQILNKPTLATVATSGSYNDLSNKPTIPTVGNGTITITQGGITKGTFTTNQSGNTTVALDAGGGGIGNIDNLTITANSSDEIQAVAVIDQNTGIAKTWTGTMAEYDAIVTKDPETEYIITDDIGGSATEIGEITEALNNKVDKGHQVIAFQAPTAGNNYTWYRKYADGWVEQGGTVGQQAASGTISINIPVEMANTYYTLTSGAIVNTNGSTDHREGANEYISKSTTSFEKYMWANWGSFWWKIEGMAA